MKSVLLVALFVLIFSVPVAAQSFNCTKIDDQAGLIKDLSQVEQAISETESSVGAEVVVVTFSQSAPFDTIYRKLATRCQQFDNGQGDLKSNLLLVMVSVNPRQVGIYAGSTWRFVDGQTQRIQVQIMKPFFKKDNFSGGISAGILETKNIIYQHQHPTSNSGGQPVVVNSQPTDLSGLWKVLGWLVGLAALGLGIFFGVRLWRSVQVARAAKRTAQQQAVSAQQKAATAVSSVNHPTGELEMLKTRVQLLSSQVTKSDLQSLNQTLTTLETKVNQASSDFTALADHSASDPGRNDLTTDSYQRLASEYSAMVVQFDKIAEQLQQLETEVSGWEDRIRQIPATIKQINIRITEAETARDKARQEGFKMDSVGGLIEDAKTALAQAETEVQSKTFGQAFVLAQSAKDNADRVFEVATTVKSRAAKIAQSIKNASVANTSVKRLISDGKAAFDRISETFAPSSWESLVGNGSRATQFIAEAETAVSVATAVSSMDKQCWDEAEQVITNAVSLAERADQLIKAIISREENLKIAKRDAPMEIDAAEVDIKTAREYLRQNKSSLNHDHKSALNEAIEALAEAKAEQQKTKPDYSVVLDLAKLANHTADEVLVNARNDREATERLRAKAASALRDAERTISKAGDYINGHSHSGSKAKDYLTQAKGHLETAQSSRDLNVQVTEAQEAEGLADKAYSKAKSAVSDYNDSQSSYNSYRPSNYGPGYSQPSYSNPGSIGGAIDWGGGGGGGSVGGATDWGGGGGGGSVGGATGW